MPVLPPSFLKRFNENRSRKYPREEEDRAARQAEQAYRKADYGDKAAQEEAQIDYDLARRIKKKRGLGNMRIGTEN